MSESIKLYALRDIKMERFMPLFQAHNDLVALREFRSVANNKALGNTIAHNTEDYDLYLVGTYDPETAMIKSAAAQLIITGVDLTRKETK